MAVRSDAWTPEEEARLIEMKQGGMSVVDIADCLGRTTNAVNFRICVLKRKAQERQKVIAAQEGVTDEEAEVTEYSAAEMREATRHDEDNSEDERTMDMPTQENAQPCAVDVLPRCEAVPDVWLDKEELADLREQALGVYAKAQEMVYFAKDEKDHRVDGLLALGALQERAWQLAENLQKLAKRADAE